MKKKVLILLGAGLFATAAFAGNDIRIEQGLLPGETRSFLHENFGDMRIVTATMDQDTPVSYEVMLADGMKVEFDARGSGWRLNDAAVRCPPRSFLKNSGIHSPQHAG